MTLEQQQLSVHSLYIVKNFLLTTLGLENTDIITC